MNGRSPTLDHPGDPVEVTIVRALSSEHRELERDLLRFAAYVPLQHRVVWLERFGDPEGWFCAARNAAGQCLGGFAISTAASRALPGHRLLRVERFCPPGDIEVQRLMLDRVCEFSRHDSRILRVSLELCCYDDARRIAVENLLARAGFTRSKSSRNYEDTLVFDLQPAEASLLAGLDAKTRRNIRMISKHPVEVRPIEDPIWAERIEALRRESMSRTGGHAARRDWVARIDFSRCSPALARIVGLFRTDVVGPEALVAFACAFSHGEYAHYDASGATRSSGLRIPMSYALLWDLILWAKSNSASWFDFGGVTLGHLKDGEDALGGISDFKRSFTRKLVHVGAEWILEPRPLRARLARAISGTAERLRAAWRR